MPNQNGPKIMNDRKGNPYQIVKMFADTDKEGAESGFYTGFVELGGKLYRISSNLSVVESDRGRRQGQNMTFCRVTRVVKNAQNKSM